MDRLRDTSAEPEALTSDVYDPIDSPQVLIADVATEHSVGGQDSGLSKLEVTARGRVIRPPKSASCYLWKRLQKRDIGLLQHATRVVSPDKDFCIKPYIIDKHRYRRLWFSCSLFLIYISILYVTKPHQKVVDLLFNLQISPF